jgi:SAM-dependent methyltransferase
MAFSDFIQRIYYSVMGTNPVIGTPIREQLDVLKERLPQEFKHRQMDDLGCGDGKVTLLLKEIFEPSSLRGFDVHGGLVRRARKRGIKADVKDLQYQVPGGELAVMWGVLHHLKDIEPCLKNISENYNMAFIREPIKTKRIDTAEMGSPLDKQLIESLIDCYFKGADYFYFEDCIFIFYIK